MKKSDIVKMPDFFDRYINLVEDIDVLQALKKYDVSMFDKNILAKLGDKVYAPGKWTAKDIIQHITDAERIFSYRALRFARNDSTALHGFEQNDYTVNTNVAAHGIDDLLHEFDTARRSTISLFEGFSDEMLKRIGTASGREVSVLAIGFFTVGHPIHHLNVLKERYYSLV